MEARSHDMDDTMKKHASNHEAALQTEDSDIQHWKTEVSNAEARLGATAAGHQQKGAAIEELTREHKSLTIKVQEADAKVDHATLILNQLREGSRKAQEAMRADMRDSAERLERAVGEERAKAASAREEAERHKGLLEDISRRHDEEVAKARAGGPWLWPSARRGATRGRDRISGEVTHLRQANADMSRRLTENVGKSVKADQQHELEI